MHNRSPRAPQREGACNIGVRAPVSIRRAFDTAVDDLTYSCTSMRRNTPPGYRSTRATSAAAHSELTLSGDNSPAEIGGQFGDQLLLCQAQITSSRTMQEFHLENILARYPELIEPGLTFISRQHTIRNKRIDLVFRGATGGTLVVEVKIGTLNRADIGQLSEYCHYVSERDGVRPRGMLVGTHVSNEIRGAAGYLGFECICLTLSYLEQAMRERGDQELLEPLRLLKSLGSAPASSSPPASPEDRSTAKQRSLASITIAGAPSSESASLVNQNGNKTKLSIADMLRSVLASVPPGTQMEVDQITSALWDTYPGKIGKGSILLSDKCYNITNAGLSANYDFRIFKYIDRGTYRYLGEGYPYSGHVTWKGIRCGLWTKGVLAKWDNWPALQSACP